MIATHLIKFFLEEAGDFSNAFSGFTTHPGLWAYDGFTASDAPEPEPTPTPTVPTGAGKRKRRWQAERKGRIYEFDTATEAQQFLQSLAVVEGPKAKKAKKFRLPDVELFYDDYEVTNLVIDKKPVIEWFYGPDLKELEQALMAMDEDDLEVILFGL